MYIVLEINSKKYDKNGNSVLNVTVIPNWEYLESKKDYNTIEKSFFGLYNSRKLKDGTYNVKAYKSVFINNFYKMLLINYKFDRLFIKDKINDIEYQFTKKYNSNIELIKELFTKDEIKEMQEKLKKRVKIIDNYNYNKVSKDFIKYIKRIFINLPKNTNFNSLVTEILAIK